jgi:cell division protein ZapB
LTIIIFFNYSGHMDADLKALEQKLSHLIALCNELRIENSQLRIDLTSIQSDTALLKSNMVEASARVEALIETFPEVVVSA